MGSKSDLQNWHFVNKADYVHSMHTQAIFLTNFFKSLMENDIITTNGKTTTLAMIPAFYSLP